MMGVSDPLTLLNHLRDIYSELLLGVLIIGTIVFGVVNSPVESDRVQIDAQRGPGGRPLPTRRKSNNQVKEAVAVRDFSPRIKTTFGLLQAAVLATFVADGVATIIQVISGRDEQWWPGQSAVVSSLFRA